jgi:hypothetical protein
MWFRAATEGRRRPAFRRARSCFQGRAPKPNCAALAEDILCINVELSRSSNCPVACRETGNRGISVRVNPAVVIRSYAKISTGKSENKFGGWIMPGGYARAAKLPGIEVTGVEAIGSQITDPGRWRPRSTCSRTSPGCAPTVMPFCYRFRRRNWASYPKRRRRPI